LLHAGVRRRQGDARSAGGTPERGAGGAGPPGDGGAEPGAHLPAPDGADAAGLRTSHRTRSPAGQAGRGPGEGKASSREQVMWAVGALAKKELRLLLRDRVAAGLLLGMPLLFILLLGLMLGESFGQKPDDTLRVSIVDLDRGKGLEGKPWAHWVYTDLQE